MLRLVTSHSEFSVTVHLAGNEPIDLGHSVYFPDYGDSPSAYASGISAMATRAYILGAVLFLALPACWPVLGHRFSLERGRNPLSNFGLLLAETEQSFQCFVIFCGLFSFSDTLFVPSESALVNLSPRFHPRVCSVASALKFSAFVRDGAHPLVRAA